MRIMGTGNVRGILAVATILVLGMAPTVTRAALAQEPQSNSASDDRQDRDSRDDSAMVTLPAGYVIPVRIADDVNSSHDKPGEMFTGTVDPSVLVHDHVVIPRGTEAHIRMVEAKKGGHVKGNAKVRLELVSLIMNGERLGVDTNAPSKKKGAGSAKADAEKQKGPQGAAVLSNPGAAAGPVIAAFAAAKVDVKPGTRIEFTLESPFTFEPPPVNSSQQN